MKQLQVHFTYNVNGAEVQDFCVVQSKTKRLSCATQLQTAFNLSKQLNVSAKDITLTHYYVCYSFLKKGLTRVQTCAIV